MDKRKILVVDDEQDLREAMSTALTQAGYEVLAAKNGAEGLELATKEKPDLIMLDIVMPEMDGLATLERLRTDAWGKTANVMLLTVLDDVESVSRAVEHGVHDYLVKTDLNLEDVVTRVKEKLGE